MSQAFEHTPVMAGEVLSLLAEVPSGVVVDATLGGAGHAEAILSARGDVELVGIDRDHEALAAAAQRLEPFAQRVHLHHARFDALEEIAERERQGGFLALEPLVAVLFDLGVSSHQLNTATRGFSFRQDGPLDMRMDPTTGRRAQDLLDELDERELAELLVANGEERFARRIASAIVRARPLTSTAALAEVVGGAIPASQRRRGHPARRVFQALRIAVNDELDVLGPALDAAIELLAPGGRVVVLSYHSGEDRIVKAHLLAASTGGCQCPPGLPCVCGATATVRLVRRGARKPTAEEIEANPRAEAARLRAATRLDASAGTSTEEHQ